MAFQIIDLDDSFESRFDGVVDGQTCFVFFLLMEFIVQHKNPHHLAQSGTRISSMDHEEGLNIRRGAIIVWAYGGYPCGEYPDLKLARKLYTGRVIPKPEFNRNKSWLGTKQ
eukprot:gene14664-19701_t